MTFAEKLMRLRKREGLSQEALAEGLGVSRQAVSRWEQGTALPDAAKLLPCARIFRVSVEWLLDENQGWEERAGTFSKPIEEREPAAQRNWVWYLAGGIVTGAGILGMVIMGILSSLYPVVLTESPAGVAWTRVYTGLIAFLKEYDMEWLFALWAAAGTGRVLAAGAADPAAGAVCRLVFSLVCGGSSGGGVRLWSDCLVGSAGKKRRFAFDGGISVGGCFLRGAAVSGNAKGSGRQTPTGVGSNTALHCGAWNHLPVDGGSWYRIGGTGTAHWGLCDLRQYPEGQDC